MTTKPGKRNIGGGRSTSASQRDVAGAGSGAEIRRPKFTIWPEWNDADINAEKWVPWETSKKEDKKNLKSPTLLQAHNYFDDPEGKIELPSSLKVDTWRRPGEFIRSPVVLDTDSIPKGFDLITTNEHLHESEFIRHCISQIITLWELCAVNSPAESMADLSAQGGDAHHSWYPWEHIYSLCKAVKGPHLPLYNVYGKYVIRLYWMGCWRKITVDDTIPFDSQGRILLPTTTLQHELWPMLLTKALIKVASLDYTGGNPNQEFGDMSVIQCLTGWIPEAIPLQQGLMNEVWELMKSSLSEWKLPLQKWQKSLEDTENFSKDPTLSEVAIRDEKMDKEPGHKDAKEKGKEKREAKDKDKAGKDEKKDKKEKGSKGKDKDKAQEEKLTSEDFNLPEKPEVVMFASYSSTSKYPVKVSNLGDMADASERLRQNGLSHMYPHPVYIAETRSCPLEPPPPPVVLPAWKLIRPRTTKTTPHDEPDFIPEEPKPVQCLKIMSPFLNYKVNPLSIPTDTHRSKSSLDRHHVRSDDNMIDEGDENAPTPPPVVSEPKSFVPLLLRESAKEEEVPPTGKQKGSAKTSREVKSAAIKSKPSMKLQEPRVESKHKDLTKSGVAQTAESGGLAPPLSSVNGFKEDTAVIDDELMLVESSSAHIPQKPTSIWMDFDVFMKCFRTLYVFHKPNTYACNQRLCEPKSMSMSAIPLSSKPDKKSSQAASVAGDSSAPFFLFVDNLAPTDIVVSYSVLAKWFDSQPPNDERERKSSVHSKQSQKDVDLNLTLNLEDKPLQTGTDQKIPTPIMPGTLIAEPFSWKSLVTGQPILRLRTTGTKSAVLSLPPGRHVLRFNATSPLGHHVHMCSSVNFFIGDEETIMPQLTSESLRFREYATQFIANLGKCMLGFSDAEQFKIASADFVKSYCPYIDNKQMSKTQNFQIFKDSLYLMLRKSLKDIITTEIAFAWRAFNFDVTTPNILSIPVGSRPDTQQSAVSVTRTRKASQGIYLNAPLESIISQESIPKTNKISDSDSAKTLQSTGLKQTKNEMQTSESRSNVDEDAIDMKATASHRSSGRISVKRRGGNQAAIHIPDSQFDAGEADKAETSSWTNRQPSVGDLVAAVKIQKAWRGYYARKVQQARMPGTQLNAKVAESLRKCWSVLEANMEENGLFLLREMFKKDPDILPYYPFYKDEWSRISYADYKGVFPEQPSMSWFLIFRDIFYAKEDMLVVPSVNVPVNTCILHVIDNDTRMEIPRVFDKVAPYVYKKNKRGYSFVAEARTLEQALASGTWRLRLIGSLNPLPLPKGGEVCCNFVTKEIRDYYVPNSKNIIFRQSVKVKDDHFASIQMNTSKRGVYFKLAVLDNEEEVISALGKGHVVIPAFNFLKTITQEDIEKRSSSRASNKASPPAAAPMKEKTSKTKRSESVAPPDQQQYSKQSLMRFAADFAERLEDTTVHKYIIQATVLQNSWPLSESSWRFVQVLKEMEKSEQKLSINERPPSPPKSEKPQPSGSKTKVKGSKEKGKDKSQDGRVSRPSSQQFDVTKPHWTLRIVSDAYAADEIEVKKDTERAEEIKAMKKAWEDAEPGRAAKALQSRLKYLNMHAIKLSQSEEFTVTESFKEETVSASSIVGATSTAVIDTVTSGSTEIESSFLPSLMALSVPPVFFNESETSLTLEPPPFLQPKEKIEPIDITPFVRKTLPEPVYMDEEVIQKLMEKRQNEIAEFKAFRENVEKWREADKQNRNLAKMRQLEQYQALQTALDEARERVNTAREAFRQRLLEAERLRQEQLALQEAALKAEQELRSPKGKKSLQIKKKK